MSRRRVILFIVVALILAGMAWPSLSTALSDWWWFEEIGYQVVFTRELATRSLLFIVTGGFASVVLYLNLRHARGKLIALVQQIHVGRDAIAVDLPSVTRVLVPIVAIGFGLLFGTAGSAAWDTLLLAWHRSPFGSIDPVFGRDISYYVFLLPALSGILSTLFLLNLLTLLLAGFLYLIVGGPAATPLHRASLGPSAARHLGYLLATLFVIIALQLWFLDIPSLVYAGNALMVGARYTDLHATLPALRVCAVAAIIVAIALVLGAQRGMLQRYAARAIGGYVLVALIGRVLYPAILQKVFVAPTELTRESPYLQNHIAATRQAWGLDSVETRELEDTGNLTLADIRNNGPTIDNVRLWDREPLLQTFGQLQEIRTYYDFLSIDDDRYWIDGRYRQVLLSPRELRIGSLPPQARNFINEHLTFTHGMGLTLGPVNQVTAEGLPVLFIKDLPPSSSVSLKVTRPQIYYGEIDYNYAVVGTGEREFDHPAGEGDVYAAYAGRGGVRVGSLLRRAMLATRFSAMNLLFSSNITDTSRVLYYRGIEQRAAKALPFLTFDRDPYLVVADDGTLKWFMDAYTSASTYPYAQRMRNGVNYMRNSVKVVIDAYDGTVTAYLSDPNDPLIKTWGKIFPGIFHPLDSLSASLRAHLRYPDELYQAQTALYATYHLDSPAEFYSREDQWQIPQITESDAAVPFMRHIIMRLPGEKEAEFVYMVPFTPRGRENLAAWMVARNDGAAYGKLRVYTLSRQSLVFGPTQIENRISQNTEISQQVSLWDQRGSKVLRGDLLVIPIEHSLLYVQPLYLQAEGGRIPELKRVVIAYQNQVVMDETLDGALKRVFGESSGESLLPERPTTTATATPATAANSESLAEAQRHYDQAMQAQREGNWARYGEEIKALGDALRRLKSGSPQNQ